MPWFFHDSLWNHFGMNIINENKYFPLDIWQLNNFVAAEKTISISLLRFTTLFPIHLPHPWPHHQPPTWWTFWKGQALADLNTHWGINYSYPRFAWSSKVLGGLMSQRIQKELLQPLNTDPVKSSCYLRLDFRSWQVIWWKKLPKLW